MKTIEMTDKEAFVTELALRIILCELLNREDLMIDTVAAVAHNLKVGSFGDKEWKPEDAKDWIQYLQPMRDLLAKLDPEYVLRCKELGDSECRLPEEASKNQDERN